MIIPAARIAAMITTIMITTITTTIMIITDTIMGMTMPSSRPRPLAHP